MPEFHSWKLQSHGSSMRFIESCSNIFLLAISTSFSFEQFCLKFSLSGELKLPSVLRCSEEASGLFKRQKCLQLPMRSFYPRVLFIICTFCICTVLNSSGSLLPVPVSDIMERAFYCFPKLRRKDFPGKLYLGKSPLQVPNTPAPFSNKTIPL